jgi:hypothetical protein
MMRAGPSEVGPFLYCVTFKLRRIFHGRRMNGLARLEITERSHTSMLDTYTINSWLTFFHRPGSNADRSSQARKRSTLCIRKGSVDGGGDYAEFGKKTLKKREEI